MLTKEAEEIDLTLINFTFDNQSIAYDIPG